MAGGVRGRAGPRGGGVGGRAPAGGGEVLRPPAPARGRPARRPAPAGGADRRAGVGPLREGAPAGDRAGAGPPAHLAGAARARGPPPPGAALAPTPHPPPAARPPRRATPPPRLKRGLVGPPARKDGLELELDAQLMCWLDQYNLRPPVEQRTPEQARADLRHSAALVAGRPVAMADVRPLSIAGAQGDLAARPHVPAEGQHGPPPAGGVLHRGR